MNKVRSDEETELIDNVLDNMINKLQMYMEREDQSLLGIATLFDFTYQPFCRLMTSRKMPDVSSLAALANRLNCSIDELVSNKIFMDIPVISSMAKLNQSRTKHKVRLPFPIADYMPHMKREFFALKIKYLQLPEIEYYNVYFKTDQISSDGVFLVNYQGNIVQLNIISVGSKFIIAESNNEEQRIPQSEIQPLAMFFNDAIVSDTNRNYIYGKGSINKK